MCWNKFTRDNLPDENKKIIVLVEIKNDKSVLPLFYYIIINSKLYIIIEGKRYPGLIDGFFMDDRISWWTYAPEELNND